ncbi:glutamine ABC superfamily ATP binding cassette transporter, permease protein [Lactobacillus selangorensis]|uniref:Glutamine ABC superfamily ATP binding cassette transporter, permease protein n=1 Tax=Lactobacillus selangorensis TaxID=81857 RepID=A0A0R2FST2_9LACO|nr:amino acid ABC transporter permease [Lactobacillus selangorensis]KRN28188.1 glutamine ABC superfamily ATP binding cassette transporter, permease protein [Lactobacillus selangorensis]KRN30936.1 glutamine ABC superfamily ATP binding cassette transporter, permease protein [Lactobacillus selangorensis]
MSMFIHFWPQLLEGLKITLGSSLIALVGSLILGTLFALLEISHNRVLHLIGRIYVEFFRNIPLLIIALFFYVIVPLFAAKLSGFTAGTLALTIYTSSFIAETVRAGIQSVDPGQMEAARANGMTYIQAMRYIVLPQAVKLVIPPLGNQFVNLVKNSSVLAFVAGFDLMYEGNLIAAQTFDTFGAYIVVGVFYLILTLPLSYFMQYLEKKWNAGSGEREASALANE